MNNKELLIIIGMCLLSKNNFAEMNTLALFAFIIYVNGLLSKDRQKSF